MNIIKRNGTEVVFEPMGMMILSLHRQTKSLSGFKKVNILRIKN